MANGLPWFKFFPVDWITSPDVCSMNGREVKGYINLLCHCWLAKDCGLPNDDEKLCVLSGLSSPNEYEYEENAALLREWDLARSVILKKFELIDGRLYNQKLLSIFKEQQTKREAQIVGAISTNGKRTAKQHGKRHAKRVSNRSVRASDSDSNSVSNSSSLEVKNQENWFSEFWQVYWRKVARVAALKAWKKAVKTEEQFQQVMAAVRLQQRSMMEREEERRPHASTWLNQERWNDVLSTNGNQVQSLPKSKFELINESVED